MAKATITGMSDSQKLEKAMDLLERSENTFSEHPPDGTWWRDYFLLTGDHMVCTEEGWQPGECKPDLVRDYGADYILDEVNTPSA